MSSFHLLFLDYKHVLQLGPFLFSFSRSVFDPPIISPLLEEQRKQEWAVTVMMIRIFDELDDVSNKFLSV